MSATSVSLEKASKEELIAKARQLASRLKHVGAKAAHATEMVMPALAATAGGAAAGFLAVKYPTIPGTEGKVPSDVALGGLCVLAAALGWGGKHNELLASFGGGLGAVAAARMTETALQK